jgi:hypothetical protein
VRAGDTAPCKSTRLICLRHWVLFPVPQKKAKQNLYPIKLSQNKKASYSEENITIHIPFHINHTGKKLRGLTIQNIKNKLENNS